MSANSDGYATTTATVCAVAMIAQQTAGKAARDAIFLSNFAVTDLPIMLIAASLASIVVVLATGRFMARMGPGRIVPNAFLLSAAFLLAEWGLLYVSPRIVAVIYYLHMASFGAVLISGFWSLVNERFDPRTAKKKISRIAAGATAGGLVGGVLAERLAALGSVALVLPALAGLHVLCGLASRGVRAEATEDEPAKTADDGDEASDEAIESGITVLRKAPYLRNLALLLLSGTVAATLVDYTFKDQASQAFTEGEELLRFFAIYYMGVGLLTFVVQTLAATRMLQRYGIARTVSANAVALGGGAALALFVPGLVMTAVARGAEAVSRSSLFRSGYELLYTPVARKDKRAAKTIIDVGFDRLGDAVGGGLVSLLLLLGTTAAHPAMLGLALALSLFGLWLNRRIHTGYVSTLEQSLLTRAEELDLGDIADSTTRSTILQTLGTVDVREILKSAAAMARKSSTQDAKEAILAQHRAPPPPKPTAPVLLEPLVQRVVELRSGEAMRVRASLAVGPPEPSLAPHLIALLGWDEVHADVSRALKDLAPRITGQLVDALLDTREEFAIRRRIPAVLRHGEPHRSAEGMQRALSDKRFEVRFRCGRALSILRRENDDLSFREEAIYDIVRAEAVVSKSVWRSRRLLDRVDDDDDGEESQFVDEVIRDRTNRSLEHTFTLLSLVLPEQPLQVAFRALHTEDKTLRGTALEYLESTLPDDIRRALWPFVEGDPSAAAPPAERSRALDSLLQSSASIEMQLKELRRRYKAGELTPPGS